MRQEDPIGLDSQCLSYLIDAMQGIEEPADSLAAEKVALFRTYLYTPGTLWVTPTVVDECSRIRDMDRRQLHDSYISVLFGEWQVETGNQLDARIAELLRLHSAPADCRVVAEAESAGFSVLLTYDDRLLRRLRGASARVRLERPSTNWEALALPLGAKPDKVPHQTNPLAAHKWWRW